MTRAWLRKAKARASPYADTVRPPVEVVSFDLP
jgi:hypothetical protein